MRVHAKTQLIIFGRMKIIHKVINELHIPSLLLSPHSRDFRLRHRRLLPFKVAKLSYLPKWNGAIPLLSGVGSNENNAAAVKNVKLNTSLNL
jgi:hypothetical protein